VSRPAAAAPASPVLRAAPGLALGLFGVSWSAVLVRLAGLPAPTAVLWRVVFSLLLVVPLALRRESRAALAGLDRRDWAALAAAGGCLGLHLILWFAALGRTSVASATVLVALTPVFVALLSSTWLHEGPTRREWLGIGLAVAGSMTVGWGDLGTGIPALGGDVLALAAALAAALYFVLGRRLRVRLGVWSYVAPVYVVAAALSLVAALGQGGELAGFRGEVWLYLAAMAAGPMLLGHTSFNWALEHVRAYVVSLVMLLEPVSATLLAIMVLGPGEVPSALAMSGAVAILAGVAVVLRSRAAEGAA
jgi:drug/metabolite transporter (DMT)-like permease